jgi:2-amino-4-hydroxy-6-hydroxymethyldihydropteridine diphosphokinase
MLHTAYIALGSNLDDPIATVQSAIAEIQQHKDMTLVAASSLYRTAPVGFADQPDFVNAVVIVRTSIQPLALLNCLLLLEAQFGRVRRKRNGPRTLDLDILLYDQQQLHTEALTIPHPRLHLRAFVLVPLAEIAPHICIPGRGTVQAWLPAVASTLAIHRIHRI